MKFKDLFKRKKTTSLLRSLIYLSEQENPVNLDIIKDREQENFKFVYHTIKDSDYCKIEEVKLKDKIVKFCKITNFHKLKNEILSLQLRKEDKDYKTVQIIIGFYSLMITLFAIYLGVMNSLLTIQINNAEIYYSKLDHIANLQIKEKEIVQLNQSELRVGLCILNNGGIDSEKTEIRISKGNIIKEKFVIENIKSKNTNCNNFILEDLSEDNFSDFNLNVKCLNCEEEILTDLQL